MAEDYQDAYKPFDGTPPPPKFRTTPNRGNLNLDQLADRLTPENALSVLRFLNAQDCLHQMPEHIIKKLLAKSLEAPPVRETSEPTPKPPTREAGSPEKFSNPKPPDGIFPDGSSADDPDIPF